MYKIIGGAAGSRGTPASQTISSERIIAGRYEVTTAVNAVRVLNSPPEILLPAQSALRIAMKQNSIEIPVPGLRKEIGAGDVIAKVPPH